MDKELELEDLNRQLSAAMYKVTELEEAIARLRKSMARDAAEHCVELSQSGPTVSQDKPSDDNCPMCDGLGEIHWSDGIISKCPSCNGTGSYTD